MKFSKSTGCFYPDEIDYITMPDDVIEVSMSDFSSAMARRPDENIQVSNGRITIVASAALKNTTPAVVTMRQAQLALLAAGLLDKINESIAKAPRAVQITWSTASTVERTNPLIASLQPALGLTDAQIDALFAQAANL